MTDEELAHQKSLVDLVIGETDEDTLDEWVGLTEEDYWYNLTEGGYLDGLKQALANRGVNTDSIAVMSYVDEQIGEGHTL